MGEWTPNTLKAYFDELLGRYAHANEQAFEAAASVRTTHKLELEQRFTTVDQRLAALQQGWHERFIGLQKAVDDRFAALAKSVDELRRLVYIGLGVALAVQLLIPMLHR